MSLNLKAAQLIVDANNGNSEAQYRYALILWRDEAARYFEEAHDIKRNDDEAVLQLNHAAKLGHLEAIKALDRITKDNEKIKNGLREHKEREALTKIDETQQKHEIILNAVQQIEDILSETEQQINAEDGPKEEIGRIVQAWFTSLDEIKERYKEKLNTEYSHPCGRDKVNQSTILFKQECTALTSEAQGRLQALGPIASQEHLKWSDYLINVLKKIINCIIQFFTLGKKPHFFQLKTAVSSQAVTEAPDLDKANHLLGSTKNRLDQAGVNTDKYPWMMECHLGVFFRNRLTTISEDTEEDIHHDSPKVWW